MRLKGLVTEGEAPKFENQEEELLPAFDMVLDLLESIEESKYSDRLCETIGDALDSFMEIMLCMEDIELEGESLFLFEEVMEELDTFDDQEPLNEYQYKPRRTSHGTKRSAASMMTGKQKQAYIKQLKKRRRVYKSNAGLRAKRKKQQYWARKTAKYKRTQKVYKSHALQRKKSDPKVIRRRLST